MTDSGQSSGHLHGLGSLQQKQIAPYLSHVLLILQFIMLGLESLMVLHRLVKCSLSKISVDDVIRAVGPTFGH